MTEKPTVQLEHIKEINTKITQLQKLTKQYVDDSEANIERLIKIIPRPGWTTPAEILLVNAILDSMIANTKQLGQLSNGLLQGASKVAVAGK